MFMLMCVDGRVFMYMCVCVGLSVLMCKSAQFVCIGRVPLCALQQLSLYTQHALSYAVLRRVLCFMQNNNRYARMGPDDVGGMGPGGDGGPPSATDNCYCPKCQQARRVSVFLCVFGGGGVLRGVIEVLGGGKRQIWCS